MELHNVINDVLLDINTFGVNKFIIITGGIGDFLTIDYFFSFSEKHNIIFITTQSLKLKTILQFYNKTNKFYSLYFDFSLIGKPGFDKTIELFKFFPELKNIKTINITEYFPLIRNLINSKKVIGYNMLFNETIIDIKNKFNIPDKFALINPYTEDTRLHCIKCKKPHNGKQKCRLTRNFVNTDYVNVFNFLKKTQIIGVIISITPIHIPDMYKDINVINLSYNNLSIIDCIELSKQCTYFFGIDSLFAIIVSKILPGQNIYIKCNNNNGFNNKELYWYPFNNITHGRFINCK
jgi:Tfp pilus assembly protein PilZ